MLLNAIGAFAALYMTGVIWFVQIVHYPLFFAVGEREWPGYHAQHTRRTGWVVAPVMIAELATAVAIAVTDSSLLTVAGGGLAAATWVFTFALAVPDHGRLEDGFDPGPARRLVVAGWCRCAAWTAHGIVALAILGQSPAA